MAYQSLYRRYRPRRFSDVRGQEHVVRALRNAVRDDRVGHAYLFSGPRGTGKTSTARILAKALNCESLTDGEPDGTCESCLAIDAGTSYDVQELDAASNNGVEAVADLIGRVNLGSPGRNKVYILDEVHMLTTAAANKLLKTLEEPPDHVIFVLATTDPQKVLPTIRSRTQHFEFHLLGAEELAEHVAWVIHDANLGLSDDVIDHVVRAGAGSARDTLSALDQVAAAGGVLDKGEALDDLLDAIAAADAGRALVAVADAVSAGRDPRILGEAVLARLRDVFLIRMGAATDHLPTGEADRIQAWADQLGDRATTRALESIGDALMEMRQAPDPRIPLEVALVKLTRPDGDPSLAALVERVARLEAALASGAPAAGSPTAPASPASTAAPGPGSPASGSAVAPALAPSPPTRPDSAGASPTAPAAPSRSRPADAARAELAARRSGSGTSTSPPPRPPASAAPAPPTRAEPAEATGPSATEAPPDTTQPDASTGQSSPAGQTPAPDQAPAHAAPASTPASPPSSPSPTAPTPSPVSSSTGRPTFEQVTEIWSELPGITGLTKGMFSAGTVTAINGSEVTVAVPNDVHREKCERKRPEVETALATALGVAVTLRLVTDGSAGISSGTAPNAGATSSSPASKEPIDDFEALDGSDVHDLPDAPDVAAGGIDALTEAFPGSELIQDT